MDFQFLDEYPSIVVASLMNRNLEELQSSTPKETACRKVFPWRAQGGFKPDEEVSPIYSQNLYVEDYFWIAPENYQYFRGGMIWAEN